MVHKLLANHRVIVLDIETTGCSKQTDRIIELGIVEYNKGKLIKEHSRLFGGGKSQLGAFQAHGISDFERTGLKTFEERGEKIASYLSGSSECYTILVGHNIKKFDLPMIELRLSTINSSLNNYKVIDTLLLTKKLQVGSDNNKLETLCEYFGIEYGNHRGLGDSKSTWELLNCLLDHIEPKSIEELFV